MSDRPEAMHKALSDAYDAGRARGIMIGANLMREYLLMALAPLTPAQAEFLRKMIASGRTLDLDAA